MSTSPPSDTAATTPSSLGVLLRILHQQFTGAVDESLAQAGFGDLRSSFASVFTFVPAEGMPVSELTRLARVRKQSMTQTVEELEKLGYVERAPSPTDRRSRLVFLTARGKKVRPFAMKAGAAIEAEWTERLGAQAMAQLKKRLAELFALLQEPAAGEREA